MSCSLKSILYDASLKLPHWKKNLCEISFSGGPFPSMLMALGWNSGWNVKIGLLLLFSCIVVSDSL